MLKRKLDPSLTLPIYSSHAAAVTTASAAEECFLNAGLLLTFAWVDILGVPLLTACLVFDVQQPSSGRCNFLNAGERMPLFLGPMGTDAKLPKDATPGKHIIGVTACAHDVG
jgi:hypothetical protein